MHWTWLSKRLSTHVHWLWAILHSIHENLAASLLGSFVVVGLLQIGLAVDAGILAVEALPPEIDRKQRRTSSENLYYRGTRALRIHSDNRIP